MKKALEAGFIVALSVGGVAFGMWLANGSLLGGSPVVAGGLTAQEVGTGYKTLTLFPGNLMSPLFITRVTVGDKAMLLGMLPSRVPANQIYNGRAFEAGDDWLNSMTIYVKNRTDKTIVWIGVELLFPDTGSGAPGQPISLQSIPLGRIPAEDAFNPITGKPFPVFPNSIPLDLQPGQEVIVHVADYMDQIKHLVERVMPLTMVTKLNAEIGSCYFKDGMRWGTGVYSVPANDPAHPGRMKDLPPGYFPGNPHHYWPAGL